MKLTATNKITGQYARFSEIDGSHPYREAVPDGFVDYPARLRHGGEVYYFNFNLAREMGLLEPEHPDQLTADLKDAILHTFSIQIINEYDIEHKTPVDPDDIKPGTYMATRYLQLQHPNKQGTTSGDGRSIWNGCYTGPEHTWDISSGGTGATRLSPASAQQGVFFKTGDKNVSYGCGLADLVEGLGTALNSEIMHHNGITTERTLAVIAFKDGTAINVRAAKNLLRPAHFFGFLKQGRLEPLQGAIDYYIERQISNGELRRKRSKKDQYQHLLQQIARDFANQAARFEMEYIFCWMDWDGDNILTNGGIIDYGSIRQFGLYHSEYRYNDVDKYSTSITEQKRMARYTVQTFAQIIDFLIKGNKTNIKQFARHSSLKLFEQTYQNRKRQIMLEKIGFDAASQKLLLKDPHAVTLLDSFQQHYRYFENAKTRRGVYTVSDGITWDAIFCVRDIMRELPEHFQHNEELIPSRDFLETIRSYYASTRDMARFRKRGKRIREFQQSWLALIEYATERFDISERSLLKALSVRSQIINRSDRPTGDGLIYANERLMKAYHKLSYPVWYHLFNAFVEQQVLNPDNLQAQTQIRNKYALKILNQMKEDVFTMREGI